MIGKSSAIHHGHRCLAQRMNEFEGGSFVHQAKAVPTHCE
jgi:hypothetical protein